MGVEVAVIKLMGLASCHAFKSVVMLSPIKDSIISQIDKSQILFARVEESVRSVGPDIEITAFIFL